MEICYPNQEILESNLTATNTLLITDRLHRANIDTALTKLNTKVDTIFTLLLDTFDHKSIVQKFLGQHSADDIAA